MCLGFDPSCELRCRISTCGFRSVLKKFWILEDFSFGIFKSRDVQLTRVSLVGYNLVTDLCLVRLLWHLMIMPF
jgi:hypothetical protein